MPSTYTDSLRFELQADGENENTWGQIANRVFEMTDQAVAGRLEVVVAGTDVTLEATDGLLDEARNAMLHVSGALTADVNIIIPGKSKFYIVFNDTSGAWALTVKTSAGTGEAIPQGSVQIVACDGTDTVLVDGNTTATDSDSLGGVAAVNYARKDQGTPTNQFFTKAQAVQRTTLSIAASAVAIDASASNCYRLVLTENVTLSNPTNPFDGQTIRIVVKQDGTGGRTMAYGSAFKFPGGAAPVLSTGANAIDYLAFEYNGADSMWIGSIAKGFA